LAVKLRLRRLGRKKKPFYRIVAADSRSPRDGRFIEEIGYYNPIADPMVIEVQEDRALYWLSQGAIPTTTVKSLLRKKGITLRFDLMKRGLTEEKITEEIKKWEVLQLERHKRQDAKKAAEKKKAEEETRKKKEEKEAAAEVAAEPEKEAVETTEETQVEKEAVETTEETPVEKEAVEATEETPAESETAETTEEAPAEPEAPPVESSEEEAKT
jgi:small subunit ribosomal protein S16